MVNGTITYAFTAELPYMKTAFIYQLINLLHKWCYSSLLIFYAQPREIHGESLQFNIQR